MNRRIVRLLAVSLFLSALVLPAAANPLRGRIAGFLDAENTKSNVLMRLETLCIIDFPEKNGLIDSLELEISIPPEIRRYRDSFAFYLYKNVTPPPTAERSSYSGKEILFEVVPSTSKFFISIPLTEAASISKGFNTVVVDEHVTPSDFPLALTVLPVMKGIPSDLYTSDFAIRAKAIFADAGLVSISITDENDETINEDPNISIDDSPFDFPAENIRLEPGIYSLEVTVEGYEPYESSFAVQKGSVQTVSAILRAARPRVYFEGPDSSLVFLDGKRIDYAPGKPVYTEPGDHIVVFQIGDYSLSKKFSIQSGKSYKISLFFDILFKEN